MSDLVEFLLARIAEDEAVAGQIDERAKVYGRYADSALIYAPEFDHVLVDPARVLAECEAKRRIVERLTRASDVAWSGSYAVRDDARASLRDLALPYADHPDFDESWRP